MRVALAMYLVLTTAAGPWLCCCTVSRSQVVCAVHDAISRFDKRPGGEQRHCCKGSSTKAADRFVRSSDVFRLANKPVGPHSCTCDLADHGSKIVALVERPRYAVAVESKCDDLHALADFLMPVDLTRPAAPPFDWTSAFALTFGSSRDYLHLHHILRC